MKTNKLKNKLVSKISETEEITNLLKASSEETPNNKKDLKGKLLLDVPCKKCDEKSLMVEETLSSENNDFIVKVRCTNCDSTFDLQLKIKEEDLDILPSIEESTKKKKQINQLKEGIVNGQYIIFDRNVLLFMFQQPDKSYKLTTSDNEEYTEDEYVSAPILNTRVKFKVVSFRNNSVKIVSMINDGVNKIKSGTYFTLNKETLNKYAKKTTPVSNEFMKNNTAYK